MSIENVVIKKKEKSGSYFEYLEDVEIKSSNESECESEDMREKE